MIPAGALDQRITIERPEKSDSPTGQRVTTWHPVRTVWANVKITTAGEREAAGPPQIEHRVTYTVTVRHTADLSPRCRIVWRETVLDIVSMIDPDNKRHDLVLTCSART